VVTCAAVVVTCAVTNRRATRPTLSRPLRDSAGQLRDPQRPIRHACGPSAVRPVGAIADPLAGAVTSLRAIWRGHRQ